MDVGYCMICGDPILFGEQYKVSVEGKRCMKCADKLTEMEKKLKLKDFKNTIDKAKEL
jgi:hypothetical protein